jgi:murein DD-endopeptidase MepM/ murein hydrolase activator NlpD
MADVWVTEGGSWGKGVWHGLPYKDNDDGRYITSAYGDHEDFRKALGWGPHAGTDVGETPIGTPLYALQVCEITHTGRSGMYAAAGEYVRMNVGGGYDIAYAHMSQIDVEVGDVVEKGDLIGLSGNTTSGGGSTAPHLHVTVRKDFHHIDPIAFLTAVEAGDPMLDQQTAMEWFTSEYYLRRSSFGGTKSQAAPVFTGYDTDGKTEVWEIRILRPGDERPPL